MARGHESKSAILIPNLMLPCVRRLLHVTVRQDSVGYAKMYVGTRPQNQPRLLHQASENLVGRCG